MSKIKKKKNNNKYIVIVAIIGIIMIATMCVIISLIIPKQKQQPNQNSQIATNNTDTTEDNEIKDEIKTLSESNRMKRYIGTFFDNIEQGKYQEAYNKLNEDYKNTYFPNLQEFTEYVDENFKSKMLGVTYDNIERLANNKTGNMYVMQITVADAKKGKVQTDFVIIEKNYNDYEMSFSANFKN